MSTPRLRIFAGPNGSGKSTFFNAFSKKYRTGYFLNADVIEKELAIKRFLDLQEYGIEVGQDDLQQFLQTSKAQSLMDTALLNGHAIQLEIAHNVIIDKAYQVNGYSGALICAFLSTRLQELKVDFSLETVMSHVSKIGDINEAKKRGFKTYLYFVCTDDPEVNISRVQNRVDKGGHPVDSKKVEDRYFRSLSNLNAAMEACDKSYLFDNSGQRLTLIATLIDGKLKLEVAPDALPTWFIDHVLVYFGL